MPTPEPSEYTGIADIFSVPGVIYLVADCEVLEVAWEHGLMDVIEEYEHLMEHLVYQDIKQIEPPDKWPGLEQLYLNLVDSEPGSDEWQQALSALNGYGIGLVVATVRDNLDQLGGE